MTRMTEAEAIRQLNDAGMITRYKGHYVLVYRRKSETVWGNVGKARSSNGTVSAAAVAEIIKAAA